MVKVFPAKNKIIVLAFLWLLFTGLNFAYFFNYLDNSNQAVLKQLDSKKKELGKLQAEFKSQSQAQRDLNDLAKKPIQPENFFSRDVTLVNELKTLEALNQRYAVKAVFSGVSGVVSAAPAAPTVTKLAVIPYGITVTGDLASVVDYIEALENLSFITNVNGIGLNSSEGGNVTASLRGNFYLRK